MGNQKINCTVYSCKYHNQGENICQLQQIDVRASKNCSSGKPEK